MSKRKYFAITVSGVASHLRDGRILTLLLGTCSSSSSSKQIRSPSTTLDP